VGHWVVKNPYDRINHKLPCGVRCSNKSGPKKGSRISQEEMLPYKEKVVVVQEGRLKKGAAFVWL